MRYAVFLFLISLLVLRTANAQAPGDSIGFTYYDYLTSGSATRNLILYEDGAMSFARLAAVDTLGGSIATYFSHYAGGWFPLTRIEPIVTGLSSIDQFVAGDGLEVVVNAEMSSVDATRGANVWASTAFPCGVDGTPRMVASDPFFVHVIAPAGTPSELVYHVSSDAGWTWSCDQSIAPFSGAVVEADAYDITTQGVSVAVIVAGAGGDVIIAESTDRGTTWTETVIYDIDETLMTEGEEPPDGSCSIIYDKEGVLNAAWGSFLSDGNGSYVESVDAGIRHWTAESGVQEVAWPDDDPAIVNPGGREGNLATQPDLVRMPYRGVVIVYSRFISEQDIFGRNYEHVFGVVVCDGGVSGPVDLTPGSGFDAAFPSAAEDTDGYEFFFVYASDPYAGNAVRGIHDPVRVAYRLVSYSACIYLKDCPCPPLPPIPLLISPVDGAVGVSTSEPLVWRDMYPWQYRIQVALDDSFNEVVIDESGLFGHSIVPQGLMNSTRYYWRVNGTNSTGTGPWSDVWRFTTLATSLEEEDVEIPSTFFLFQNHPNPFNPMTTIRYSLPRTVDVDIRVLDLLGEEVAILVSGREDAGTHSVTWDASGQPSGVYFYRLEAGGYVETKKLVLLR